MNFFLCLLVLFKGMLFAEAPPVLHALILAETRWESYIARGVQKDMTHVTKALQTISKKINYQLELTVVQGPSFTTKSLHKWLLSLPCSNSDITFFYYSGHGCSDLHHKPWPAMALSDAVISGSLVVEHIKKNRHRLDIVLFDSCNSKSDVVIWQNFKNPDFTLSLEKNMPGLKKLFLNTNALIIAAAAKRGEDSGVLLSGHHRGSFFTNAFFASLKKYSKKKAASWENVFRATNKDALKLSDGFQHLVYTINPN